MLVNYCINSGKEILIIMWIILQIIMYTYVLATIIRMSVLVYCIDIVMKYILVFPLFSIDVIINDITLCKSLYLKFVM